MGTVKPGGLLSFFHFVFRRKYFRTHSLAGALTRREDVCVYKVSKASIFYPYLYIFFFLVRLTMDRIHASLFAISLSVFLLNVYPQAVFYRIVTR